MLFLAYGTYDDTPRKNDVNPGVQHPSASDSTQSSQEDLPFSSVNW
jgi:hypothetical protein